MSPQRSTPQSPWGTIKEIRKQMESFELGDGSLLCESHTLRPFREKDDGLEARLVRKVADGLSASGYELVPLSRPELKLTMRHWEKFSQNWKFEGYRSTADELETIQERHQTEVGFHITTPFAFSLLREFWAFSPIGSEPLEFEEVSIEEFHLGLSPKELIRYMNEPKSLLQKLEALGFEASTELIAAAERGGDNMLLVQVDLRGLLKLDQAIATNVGRNEARTVYFHETAGYDGEPLSELKCLMPPHPRCLRPVAVIERRSPAFENLGFYFR